MKIGDVLKERYELISLVGQGGEARVFLARDRQHDRRVAIKVRAVESKSIREHVLSEARVLLDLTPHPNLPVARDDFFDEDRHCLVVDYIEGKNLAQLAQSAGGKLPLASVVSYLEPVSEALDHLHNHEPPIVHGDVKPSNVVVSPKRRTVLVDFGLAAGAPYGSGSAGFIAPEVAAGERPTPASDIYGLSAAIFTLLANKVPAPGEAGDWEDLDSQDAARVKASLERGLAADPNKRPTTAAELLTLLRGGVPDNNLPVALSSFVGRDEELTKVADLLKDHRLLTLAGAGGSGKTRLAIEAARTLIGRFPGGAWLIELAPIADPSQFLSSLAEALGVRDEPGLSLTEAIRSRLSNKRFLLVLDNCEHLLAQVAETAESILRGSTEAHIICTSREPLGITAEIPWVLPSMDLPPESAPYEELPTYASVRLFLERMKVVAAHGEAVTEDLGAVAEICRKLDGMPLAIEMAAALAWDMDVLEILAGLSDRFRVLEGSRTAIPRHRTLRTALDWSYELLREDERVMLRRLAGFAGGFRVEAAEYVTGETADVLDRLQRKSLVQPKEARWTMLESVREYAGEKLAETGETASVSNRHLDWFLRFAEERSSEEDIESLSAESDNLRAALEWAFNQERAEALAELCLAVYFFWYRVGLLSEGRAWFERALSLYSSEDTLGARLFHKAGLLAFDQGELDQAENALKRALALSQAINDRQLTGNIIGNLGNVAIQRGDLTAAADLNTQALQISRELGNKKDQLVCLNNLGLVADLGGDIPTAIGHYSQAGDLAEELGDGQGVFVAKLNMGALQFQSGDVEVAERAFLSSLEIARELQFQRAISAALANLALIAEYRGDYSKAFEIASEVVEIAEQIGDRAALAMNLGNSAGYLRQDGRLEHSIKVGQRALEVSRDFPQLHALALVQLGATEMELGHLDQARTYLEKSLEVAEKSDLPEAKAMSLLQLGTLSLKQGRLDEARERLLGTLEVALGIQATSHQLDALMGLAQLCDRSGKFEEAAALLAQITAVGNATDKALHPADVGALKTIHERALTELGERRYQQASKLLTEVSYDQISELVGQ